VRAWIVDVSGWQIKEPPDYKVLAERGCSAVIIKGSMGGGISTAAAIQATVCREVGIPYIGMYHWADPIHRTPDQQMRHIERAINIIRPDFIAVDNEQWWGSWTAYHQFVFGEISFSVVPKLDPNHISNFGRKLTRRVSDTFGMWTLNYTAGWFINRYAPRMTEWINEFDLWMALYPLGNGQFESWQDFEQFVNVRQPAGLPRGAKTWSIWQFTAKHRLPGFARAIDLNIFNGSVEDLKAKINKETPAPSDPPPSEPYYETYRCNAPLGMIVRDAPNGRDVGKRLRFGTIFQVYEKVVSPPHTWGRIHPNQSEWVSLSWSNRIT